MAKPRVHEVAKELGVSSKDVMTRLTDMGEFVRSASSTLEAPVIRRLREQLGGSTGAATPASGTRPATVARSAPTSRSTQAPPFAASSPTVAPALQPANGAAAEHSLHDTGPATAPSTAAPSTAAPSTAAPSTAAPSPAASSPLGVTTPVAASPSSAPRPAPRVVPSPAPAFGRETVAVPPAEVQTAPPSGSGPFQPAATTGTGSVSPEQSATAAAPPASAAPATAAVDGTAPAAYVPTRPSARTPGGLPGARPGSPTRPAPARPGNNPFSSSPSGMGRAPAPGLLRPAPGAPATGPGGGVGQVPGAPTGAAATTSPTAPRPSSPVGPRPPLGAGGPRPVPAGGPRPNPGGMPPRPGGFGGPRPGGLGGGPRPNPGGLPPRTSRPVGPGAGRPGGPGGRPGGPGGPGGRPGGFTGGPGGRAGAPGGAGGPGAGPGGFAGRPGGPGGAGGRGRGGTQGAFGRGGQKGRARKSKRQKRQEYENFQAPSFSGTRIPRGDGRIVRLSRGSSLSDLGEQIGVDAASLVKVLLSQYNEVITATQSVGDETLQLLGTELNYDIQVVSPEDEDRELLEQFDLSFGGEEDEEDLVLRPPVVTVMGHVDHGKTRLLDAIRKTKVAEKEAGGITQHIGAYQVVADTIAGERPITFIDTPGHEAFTAMRARGAQTTDIVVLVVAADDGVKPQTTEALNHAQAAGAPIVVAVNKVDKPGADPTLVRSQLTEYGLVAEEFGGQTLFIDVSALTGQGIPELLEAIVLTADAELDLRANPDRDAQGIAIEAHLDRGRGPVATMLVQRGTLHVGDSVVAGDAYGRVRALLDDTGQPIQEALPSRPVQVLGLSAVPGAGDQFVVVAEDRIARQIAERREARERAAELAKSFGRRTLEDVMKQMEQGELDELLLILKGDVSGSVEALEDALLKIHVGEDVSLRVISRGVGAITENDVNLAAASNAFIIGFNVRAENRARELADRSGVDIRYYTVIYSAIDEVEAALKGKLKPEYETIETGSAEIRDIFRSSRFGNIAGCLVTAGEIRRNAKVRLVRDGAVVTDALSIASLRREKDDATSVREGFECGISLGAFNDIRVGDRIETFDVREKARA